MSRIKSLAPAVMALAGGRPHARSSGIGAGMDVITWVHIAGGVVALLAGAAAVAVRKGGRLHARAGTAFFVSMLMLGVTAFVLGLVKPEAAGLGIGGVFTCYFVTTSWMAARRRDGWIHRGHPWRRQDAE